jgi:lipopolysaccharide export system permease protein
MKILSRYLFKTIASSTLIVLLVFLGLDFFIQLMGEFKDVGDGNYTLWTAMSYVLMTMPNDLYTMFPMAGLLGALMGLGHLASNSELVVMRSSGMTLMQIVRVILGCILVFVLLVSLFYETIAPQLTHQAEIMRATARARGQAVATQYGVWVREGDSFFHFDAVKQDGTIEGLTRYQFDDTHHLTQVSYAASGAHQGNGWEVQSVHTTQIAADKTTATTETKAWWPLKLDPIIVRIAAIEPNEMTLWRLRQVIHYQRQNELRSTDYVLNFWQRMLMPLMACVMMFLAIPFIFGPLRSATMGLRLVAGISLGFLFYILNQFAGKFFLFSQIPPIFAVLTPLLLFAVVGLVLLKRVR